MISPPAGSPRCRPAVVFPPRGPACRGRQPAEPCRSKWA